TLMRTTWPPLVRVTVALRTAPIGWVTSLDTSIGAAASNTNHTASARRNTAAGVAPAKGNVSRRPSPTRTTSTSTGAFASRGGGAATAGVTGVGRVTAGAGASLPLEATAP